MDHSESLLQTRLRKKIDEAGVSPHALEKQAGLKRSAVQNILYGKSKKPSAEILGAITKILGCSINDLLDQQNVANAAEIHHLAPSEPDTSELDTALYAKAVQTANKLFKTNYFNYSVIVIAAIK